MLELQFTNRGEDNTIVCVSFNYLFFLFYFVKDTTFTNVNMQFFNIPKMRSNLYIYTYEVLDTIHEFVASVQ